MSCQSTSVVSTNSLTTVSFVIVLIHQTSVGVFCLKKTRQQPRSCCHSNTDISNISHDNKTVLLLFMFDIGEITVLTNIETGRILSRRFDNTLLPEYTSASDYSIMQLNISKMNIVVTTFLLVLIPLLYIRSPDQICRVHVLFSRHDVITILLHLSNDAMTF